MPPRRRLGKKFLKSLLPILLLLAVAMIVALAFIVYGVTRPPRRAYLVTPEEFSQISGPVLRVTEEAWSNGDGKRARGWLLRGIDGAPAVWMAHRNGADRSWLFNLGVKINETTNFTVLWIDLRGHGLNPPVGWTSFGSYEGDDIIAAIDFLRTLKTTNGQRLIGENIGLYGVELGAYAALHAATRDNKVIAMVLDSVPRNPDELLEAAVRDDLLMNLRPVLAISRLATRIYFLGGYKNTSSCAIAASLENRRILLLSGRDAGYLRDSTVALARCFPKSKVEIKADLPLTGFRLPSATGEQGEAYDRQVIDFLDRNLR
ncbi:MAG: hypothetical protein ACRD8U_01240 [Pyrinomonadaceae bacterium]